MSLGLCALRCTAKTVPCLIQLRRILTQGRIKAMEMKRAIATIAAKKESAGIASCAIVVVVGLKKGC